MSSTVCERLSEVMDSCDGCNVFWGKEPPAGRRIEDEQRCPLERQIHARRSRRARQSLLLLLFFPRTARRSWFAKRRRVNRWITKLLLTLDAKATSRTRHSTTRLPAVLDAILDENDMIMAQDEGTDGRRRQRNEPSWISADVCRARPRRTRLWYQY